MSTSVISSHDSVTSFMHVSFFAPNKCRLLRNSIIITEFLSAVKLNHAMLCRIIS